MSSRAALSLCMIVYDGKKLLLQLQLGPLGVPFHMERLGLGWLALLVQIHEDGHNPTDSRISSRPESINHKEVKVMCLEFETNSWPTQSADKLKLGRLGELDWTN